MTLFQLSIRQLLAGTRWMVLLLLTLTPALLAALEVVMTQDRDFINSGLPGIVLGVVVPILALITAGSVFATDLEDGTAVFVLTKPVPRFKVLLTRYGAAVLVAGVLGIIAAALVVAVQGRALDGAAEVLRGASAAAALGGVVYTAIFAALSISARRGNIIGLLYILIWESALAAQFPGTSALSVKSYMHVLAGALDSTGVVEWTTSLTVSSALTSATVVTLIALGVALRKLRNYEVLSRG